MADEIATKQCRQQSRQKSSENWTAVAENQHQSGKNFAPAAARNTEAILAELQALLPKSGNALELASGTGQHVCAYGAAFPGISWQPSDANLDALESIAAWREECGLANVLSPMCLDLTAKDWHREAGGQFDVMIAANLLHISPWQVSLALFEGAGHLLRPDGLLFVYGCFSRAGDPVSDSNQDFDRSLRARDERWGIRDTVRTATAVEGFGLVQSQVIEMPANNTVIVVRRQ